MKKDPIYALTPEVGSRNDWFWPETGRIIPLCQENVFQNLQAASFLLNTAILADKSPTFIEEPVGNWSFEVTKFGVEESAIQMKVEPVTDNISFPQASKFYFLDALGETIDQFEYELINSIQTGDEIIFAVSTDNGILQTTDTIRKVFASPTDLFDNNGRMDQFQVDGWLNSWGESNFEYYSAPTSLADSPNGNYLPGSIGILETSEFVPLNSDDEVFLTFKAKWDIKAPSDYFQILISVDKEEYIPLCGKYSTLATREEVLNEPIYTGRQDDWIIEEIDISEYSNRPISLRFALQSNGSDTRDGIFIDDILIQSVDRSVTTALNDLDFMKINVYPNPVREELQITVAEPFAVQGVFLLYNSTGQRIHQQSLSGAKTIIDTSHLPTGPYYLQVLTQNNKLLLSRKIIVTE